MSETVVVAPVAPVANPPQITPAFTTGSLSVPSTKRLIGVLGVIAIITLAIAWIALSVRGLAGWINIVLMITAVLLIVIVGWLFFSA